MLQFCDLQIMISNEFQCQNIHQDLLHMLQFYFIIQITSIKDPIKSKFVSIVCFYFKNCSSPPRAVFLLNFPEMHILTPNWVTLPKISYYPRKKQFCEIWPFHSLVVTSLSRLVGSCKLMIMCYIFLRGQMMFT